MRARDGDFNSMQRYLKLWDFVNVEKSHKKSVKIPLGSGMKKLLTVPLKFNVNLFEIILSSLALNYRQKHENKNKNKNKNKNNNDNNNVRMKKEILKVIDWLFKQITNNNREAIRIKRTTLNTIAHFSCTLEMENINSDIMPHCFRNLDMVNTILEYLISNKIQCVFPPWPTNFYTDYFDIYIGFLDSTCTFTQESLPVFVHHINHYINDKNINNEYCNFYKKFLIQCLINLDKLFFNAFEIEYRQSNKLAFSSIRTRIENYDQVVNQCKNIRAHFANLQSFIWQNVSQTSHKNITQLIGASRNKFHH